MADRGSELLLAGAAMGPARSCPSGFGAGFVQPMVEDGLGMCRSPAVGQQLVQPLVIRMQAQQKIAYVAPRLDPMTLRTGEDRTQHRRAWPRRLTAQEEPIFSANGLVPKGPLAHVIVCALARHVESSGANPDRRRSSQPEALGAVQEVTNGLKHSKKRLRRESAGYAGCNAQ